MKSKLRIAILVVGFLFGVTFGQEPTVIPLVPVEVWIKPPIDNDTLGKEFLAVLTNEFKKTRGVFKVVGEDDRKHCVIIFAVSPIHSNIGLRGYSASYNVVTKSGGDLKLDTISISAPNLKEVAEIAVKETTKLFSNEKPYAETSIAGNSGTRTRRNNLR